MQIQKRYVEDLQRKYDAEMLQRPVSVAANEPVVPPLELARRKRIQGLQDEISEIDRQRTIREKEAAQLRKNSGILQQRLDAVPARESEMTELTRDYGTLSSLYNGLLAKKQESKIAANLQSQQIGEQLKLLDPARLPEEPASPNRPLINVIGMVAGLGIGVLFVLLLEYRDASFQTDSEITELLQLPVLAVVPLMESRRDKRRAMRRRVIVGVGLGSTVAGCLAVVLYTFVR